MTENVDRSLHQQLLMVVKDPVFIKQMIWVVLLGVLMVVIILLNIDYLQTHYPEPPRPPDRVLDAIPVNYDFLTVGEAFSKLQVGIMAFFFFSSADRLRRLPTLFFLLALMYILRSYAFTLTPLAQISPPGEHYVETDFIAQNFYYGMYFSGHFTSALMQAFFFWDDRLKGIRISWIVLPFALVQAMSLLVSHQHYSIDIFAAIFIAYFFLTFDFMQFVPKPLLDVHWMPWYVAPEA